MKKYVLLLVEDENIIRRGLRHMIDKFSLGIDVIEACDGVEALEMCAASHVDILLTDIVMPKMDGLALVAALSDRTPSIACIIFSGYREFDYAKKAIQYNVEDYLLKPVERDSLRATLTKVISTLDQQQEHADSPSNQDRQDMYNLWIRLMSDECTQFTQKEQKLLDEIDFDHNALLLLGMYNPSGRLYESILLLEKKRGVARFSYNAAGGYVFHVILTPAENAEAYVNDFLHLDGSGASMYSVLSRPCRQIKDIAGAYRQCVNYLNDRLLYRCDPLRVAAAMPAVTLEIPTPFLTDLESTLATHDLSRATEELHLLFRYLMEIENMNSETLIKCIQSVELFLLNGPHEHTLHIVSAHNRLRSLDYLLSSSETIEAFEEAVFVRLQYIVVSLRSVSASHSPIAIVLDYLNSHYAEDISAIYCSNLISMNTSYFSTFFKKKTGLSFVNYLQKLRVQKAAGLLSNSDLRIYEIAEKTGFNDEKYFYKVFKQHFAVTPMEYREQGLPDAPSTQH
ncbi:MAG: response regulator [Eubacteriales bacterium]|nr:response regulator [Eubacteriales bacterium]